MQESLTKRKDTESKHNHVDALLDAAYNYRGSDLRKSIEMVNESLQSALDCNYARGEARARLYLSLFLTIRCEFDLAIDEAYKALDYYQRVDDESGIALSKYNIGSIHYRTDNYHLGLLYLMECLRIFRELNDFHNQARTLKSMGTIYEYFQDYNNAEDVYLQSIEVSKLIGDRNLESNAYNPLSGIYLKRGEIDKAFETVGKSIAIKNETGDRRGLGFAIYGRAKIFFRQQKYDLALADFEECLSIHKEAGDQLGLSMVHNKLGRFYFEIKNYKNSRIHFNESLLIANRLKINLVRFKVYYQLYLLSKEEGNVAEALSYLEKYFSAKESVINSETYQILKSYEEKSKVESLEYETKVQKEKNEIIELKNAELDSFFYRVSHDLKGPISSLLGLHNLVKLEVKDETSIRFFDMYQTQLNRINNIVISLINLTQMKHVESEKVKIDFLKLIDECIHSYAYLDVYPKINFIKNVQPGLEFASEWAIINTIIQNLVENAIKYSRPDAKPFVKIDVRGDNHNFIIQVEDNGQGIHPDHQVKIFDMFYRANQRAQGSGLGLYILKRAVERLNGQITLKSTLNEGSVFTIILPY